MARWLRLALTVAAVVLVAYAVAAEGKKSGKRKGKKGKKKASGDAKADVSDGGAARTLQDKLDAAACLDLGFTEALECRSCDTLETKVGLSRPCVRVLWPGVACAW